MVASVGAIEGTWNAWPSRRTTDSAIANPITAVPIGSAIAVAVPKANSRITTAAAIPITSLLSVAGLDSFWPT